MTERKVLEAYNRRKSIRATARELGISEGVVKKYLIGLGIYKTPLTKRIAELRAAGMPPKDIADLLGLSSSAVSANMSYVRPSYLSDTKSLNAMRIKACRQRKAEAKK